MILSTRRGSTSMTSESCGESILISESLSRRANPRSSTDRRTRETMSTLSSERTATSASKRLTSRRSERRFSNLSICPKSNSELRAITGSKFSRDAWITSAAIRIVVNGVRNSWETSETKRCCTRERFSNRLIWRSRVSAISLNAEPRRATSSWPLTSIRWRRSPDVSCSATSAACFTGLITCLKTTEVVIMISAIRRNPVPHIERPIKSIVRCCPSNPKSTYISYLPTLGIVILCPITIPLRTSPLT